MQLIIVVLYERVIIQCNSYELAKIKITNYNICDYVFNITRLCI